MLNAIHGEEEATKNARQRHSVLTATNLRVAARDWIGASSTRVHRSETTGLQTEWLLPQMCPPTCLSRFYHLALVQRTIRNLPGRA